MLDLDLLRSDPDRVRDAMRAKRIGDPEAVSRALDADARRRAALTEQQTLQTRQGEVSREIGPLMKAGRRDDAAPLVEESNRLKEQVKALDETVRAADADLRSALLEIPNVPHASVPVGGAEANLVDLEWGERPAFVGPDGGPFQPLPHWEIAARHGLVDFERGAKVAGAGFPFYVGRGARLQRALVALFLDLAGEAGYTEVQAPILVNEASGIGTGQLPDKEGQMYGVPVDGLYLIPTAEVPLTNYHRDEIFDAAALPVRYCGYTPCFRREAGSYGKDVRGLNRLHQFDKVELVEFVHPSTSYERLDALRDAAERAVRALELPYRRLVLATADMGVTQAKTYDLEVWSAGQERWLEVSSVSNFESYQARRANVRFRPAPVSGETGGARPEFVHTLNGSGLALPRIVAALLENGQQADGSVRLPPALAAYTGFDVIG